MLVVVKVEQKTDLDSIREFCTMDMPIIMYDKDDNFVVATLEEVRLAFCLS